MATLFHLIVDLVTENTVSTDGAMVQHVPLKYVNCNVLQNQNLANTKESYIMQQLYCFHTK